jgi:hypothetical protein
MAKMGQELDRRLDENKYEMYEALRELTDIVDNYLVGVAPPDVIDSFSTQPAKQVLAKIED